jgi:toxin-antitoxin system PIN domain toxin
MSQNPERAATRIEGFGHLDSMIFSHLDASMRTTVTLDKDVERMLREAMHRSRQSFKETLNGALRAGLSGKGARVESKPFIVQARPLGLRGDRSRRVEPARGRSGGGCLSREAGPPAAAMILPDINLLLDAYDAASSFHGKAVGWWQECLSGSETVGLPPVVVFGFVRLATNARVFMDSMTPTEAAQHVRSWLAQPVVRVLDAPADPIEPVLTVPEKLGTAGNLVTDAQIAVLALEYDAVLHTNDTDFLRFEGLRCFNPLTGAASARGGRLFARETIPTAKLPKPFRSRCLSSSGNTGMLVKATWSIRAEPNAMNACDPPESESAAAATQSRLGEWAEEMMALASGLRGQVTSFGPDGEDSLRQIEIAVRRILDELTAFLATEPGGGAIGQALRHDFNNWIQSVTGNATLILMEPTVTEPARSHLTRLGEVARAFSRLLP